MESSLCIFFECHRWKVTNNNQKYEINQQKLKIGVSVHCDLRNISVEISGNLVINVHSINPFYMSLPFSSTKEQIRSEMEKLGEGKVVD
jgi:hypothetical protein